jgi:hypothetical protein
MTGQPQDARLVACATSRLVEATGFAIGGAVLGHDPVSPADGHPVHGLQPVVGEQLADEPGFVDEAHSRVEPRLPDVACSADAALWPWAQLVDAAYSAVEPPLPDVACSADAVWPPVRFQAEACFEISLRSLPHEACSRNEAYSLSQCRLEDEEHCCVLLECCARHCRVEEHCSPHAEPAYSPTAWLLED